MKVLAINGSPRKGGNTDILLDKVIEGSSSVGAAAKKLDLNSLSISPTQEEEYDTVTAEGFSIIDDDIHVVFREIAEADAVILGSPIFFGSLSAQVKTMIDRFHCVWFAKTFKGIDAYPVRKKGALICVEGDKRNDFFANASFITRHFFTTINVEYTDELFCPSLNAKGSVREHTEYLEKAFEIGRRIAGEEK